MDRKSGSGGVTTGYGPAIDVSDIDCDSGLVDVETGIGSAFAGGTDSGADSLTSDVVEAQPIRKTKRQIYNANLLFNISRFFITDI
jgi:hypothetical protein